MTILVLNAGSSSVKFALFEADGTRRLQGAAAGIGGTASLEMGGARAPAALSDHEAAFRAILAALSGAGLGPETFAAAAHRVVHGGPRLTAPARLTPEVVAEIEAASALAPLHTPHNLRGIRALAALAPELPQVACFDTAFHATMPRAARDYALPHALAEAEGLRRYGFHGLSYAALVARLPALSGAPLPGRLLAYHLGNGASAAAIREGRSVATTMGVSPLDGLTMGTRVGGIDASAVLHLAERHGIARTREILNAESGLLGLSGESADMRTLLASPHPGAARAIDHFCHWAVRHGGALIAAMGGLDAVAFTGGIGENAPAIRARISDGLGWAGVALDAPANAGNAARLHEDGARVGVWRVPAEEEWFIAREARAVLGAERMADQAGDEAEDQTGDQAGAGLSPRS
ncbi:MAG: acetate/propionate family kinase [Pseudomonadota bacterium]